MKRRITIGTSGIEPETRVKTCHLPLVVYAVAALEANQGDKRKTYYVLAQVWANRPLAVTPGGRTSHIEGISEAAGWMPLASDSIIKRIKRIKRIFLF